jgi:glycosyltransferase involved in cell wall biosynthesis
MWRERQQIMSRLANDNKVIYVEPERDSHKSYGSSLWHNMSHLPALRARSISDNLVVYSGPPGLPYAATALPAGLLKFTSPTVASINSASMLLHIRRILAKEGVSEFILWSFGPFFVDLVGKLGEKMCCYYVYDEIAEFKRNVRHKDFLEKRDRDMTKKADVVFASSRAQYEKRLPLNSNTYLTPHGVDFDHYHKALDPKTTIPEDIATINKPIVGYIGTLSLNLDAELLIQISEALPDWNVVLVGPDNFPRKGAYERLKNRNNVHLLGFKDVSLIPGYLKAFDVAILPYQIVGHTRYAYPCKLHEYLASGKPVVAFPLPELIAFQDVIELARSPDEFVRQIKNVRVNDASEKTKKRIAVARQNTWDHRVSLMSDVMDKRLSFESKSGKVREPAVT